MIYTALQATELPKAKEKLTAVELAARIDQRIEARWAGQQVQPAPAADDAEIFRRLSLDLNGRIPTIVQIKDFLDDKEQDKLTTWTEELFRGRDNAELFQAHWTNYWWNLLFAQATVRGSPLRVWLRDHVKNNTPYDQLVRELLTQEKAAAFYQAYEHKPENIAAVVGRVFLGLKREWPPNDDDRAAGNWSRLQSWEFAAFFAGVARGGKGPAELKMPDGRMVRAKFPDGEDPKLKEGDNTLEAVADWLTRPGNPYFARHAVNRLWATFFGVGLVEPVDGGGPDNPPSHPELLDELAQQFVANQFDLRYLFRAFTGSKVYRRTSAQSHDSQSEPRRFARMAVRRQTPEQLWDSLALAAGYPGDSQLGLLPGSPRSEFLSRFRNRAGVDLTAQEALQLMNGKIVGEATNPDRSRVLATIANMDAKIPTTRRVQELFFVALARAPNEKELEKLVKYVEDGGPTKDPKKALADVFWALLNSSEFAANH
jgi:hypothetical protein